MSLFGQHIGNQYRVNIGLGRGVHGQHGAKDGSVLRQIKAFCLQVHQHLLHTAGIQQNTAQYALFRL